MDGREMGSVVLVDDGQPAGRSLVASLVASMAYMGLQAIEATELPPVEFVRMEPIRARVIPDRILSPFGGLFEGLATNGWFMPRRRRGALRPVSKSDIPAWVAKLRKRKRGQRLARSINHRVAKQ